MRRNEYLLYYRTREEIERYRKLPALQKLRWVETMMEFLHKAMPEKAKRIRDGLFS
jgi:hypothetical protein